MPLQQVASTGLCKGRVCYCGMTVLQPKGFYSRLFPVPTRSLSRSEEEKLIRLGDAMRYNVEREGTLTPRVGYTYFSQFVGHDLTYDPTPLDNFAKPIPARALEKCRRSRAPWCQR